MLKRILSMAIAGIIAAGSAMPAAAEGKKNVLVVLWRGETESEASYKTHLKNLGVDVTFTEINGEQDRGKLANKVREVEGDIAAKNFDVIYSYGTSVTQVVTGIVKNRVPVVFNIVFDPVEGKLIPNATEPGIPVTGVTNGVPLAEQFQALAKLGPIKKMAIFFNAREANSAIIEKAATEWAAKNGVSITPFKVTPGNDSAEKQAAEAAKGGFDVVYLPADTYLASVADKIIPVLSETSKVYGGTQTFVLRGALASFAPQVTDMGVAAANLTARILKGEDAGKMSVVLPEPKLFVSESAARKAGITIPAGSVVEK